MLRYSTSAATVVVRSLHADITDMNVMTTVSWFDLDEATTGQWVKTHVKAEMNKASQH